jgi:hypothetical protein
VPDDTDDITVNLDTCFAHTLQQGNHHVSLAHTTSWDKRAGWITLAILQLRTTMLAFSEYRALT